jgi:hypothetical protein
VIWSGAHLNGVVEGRGVALDPAKHFSPSVKKGEHFDVPDEITAHLTRKCGGNVPDRDVVNVTSGYFEKETEGVTLHSGAFDNDPKFAAKNTVDLEAESFFGSAYRSYREEIHHTRHNWVCYDFKERRILPTHYTIRTNWQDPSRPYLKSWFVGDIGMPRCCLVDEERQKVAPPK